MAKNAKNRKIAKTVKKWRLNVKNPIFAKIGKTVKNVQKRGHFAKTPFLSLFKKSRIPGSPEMSLFGPLFDRSGKDLDYLDGRGRCIWPDGEKGGQKRGPKMGHFGGRRNPRKWWNFHVFGANCMFSRPPTPKWHILGPLLDRSGKYLDYLEGRGRGIWPEGQKRGPKRGSKKGSKWPFLDPFFTGVGRWWNNGILCKAIR